MDWLDIANETLVILGQPRISTLDETTGHAPVLDDAYPLIRDQVLRSFVWNCAKTRALLAPTADDPHGWDYAYNLPVLPWCLRVVRITDDVSDWTKDPDYTVEGRQILTDAGSGLYVQYIKRVTEAGELDSLCAEAIALKLALRVCYKITQSTTMLNEIRRDFDHTIREARSAAAIESMDMTIDDAGFEDAR